MKLTEKAELAKGVSNLAIAMGCMPEVIAIAKSKGKRTKLKRSWTIEFVLLTLAAFVGAAVHSIVWSDKTLGKIWSVLYSIEFELVRRLYTLMAAIDDGYEISKIEYLIIFGTELLFFVPATTIRLKTGKNTFSFFLAYAAVIAVMLGKIVAKQEKRAGTKDFILSIISLITAMLCQIIDKNHGAIIAHVFILLSLLPLTHGAIKTCE